MAEFDPHTNFVIRQRYIEIGVGVNSHLSRRYVGMCSLNMASIGETLKQARENKGLSLESVSQATRINPRVLRALEADEFDKLVPALYIKGFLKKYAEFLRLNSNEIVNAYLALNPPPAPAISPVAPRKENKFFNTARLKIIILFLGGCILTLSLFKLFTPSKRDFSRMTSKKTVTRIKPRQDFSIPKGENLILKIKARKDTWLQLKSDGKVVFQHILGGGKEESWEAKDNFELWVGDAESLTLSLNGKPLGSLGRGVKRDILINRQGLQLPF